MFMLMFLAGCVTDDYRHNVYAYGKLKESIKVSRNMANINQTTGSALIKLADGTVVYLSKHDTKADPNSAIAEAELVKSIMTGGCC